ncbi:polysaccharide deacetylase family protein [Arsenicibacter rosenii]|uniref:Polysaccharide deacetylase n=1 Tax=Arsenicibacter rosenii TaxID=1750698 RepID=A0A1S2VA03_9BACT|nr:polysaccharide deacetylase [Arsenicibacter rosenii]OIN55543.1 polysaccharide deacetylase [Arsenicibacter rosenii]
MITGLCLTGWAPAMAQLAGYTVFFGATAQKPTQIALRSWSFQGRTMYWLVNPQTMKTSVAALPQDAVRKLNPAVLQQQFSRTPYGRALASEKRRDTNLQDAGIERADTTERGFSLTIDLCPSTKPLTRSVFENLIAAFETEEKPIPVTITVSGLWMNSHQDDLAYLKSLVAKGDLDITWVNHSYHHRFDPKRPLPVNFLLEPNTNIAEEVLLNEQTMLQNGLVPSVFFRFPGLVSDKSVFDRILGFGLLPIGSDAWLAKGQQPKPGSLVLIHANGNEPVGINDFIQLIRQKSASIRSKQWLLYELPESVLKSEGNE